MRNNTKWLSSEVLIQACNNDSIALVSQLSDNVNDCLIKNCTSSMPMTSVLSDMCVIMSFGEATAIPSNDEPLCDTTELVLYRLSIDGLNILLLVWQRWPFWLSNQFFRLSRKHTAADDFKPTALFHHIHKVFSPF